MLQRIFICQISGTGARHHISGMLGGAGDASSGCNCHSESRCRIGHKASEALLLFALVGTPTAAAGRSREGSGRSVAQRQISTPPVIVWFGETVRTA